MQPMFPEIEPNSTFMFPVSGNHTLYVETAGNPDGIPVIFLHGGPGAGISPRHRRLFDPKGYHIILFDQRGSGKSTPHASLEDNTTWDLVADIEALRHHFKIEKWLVFGGSWGSTLALAYAQKHPENISGLILRGIFLTRKEEINWFYQNGAHQLYPDEWAHYIAPIPEQERDDLVTAFYRHLTDADESVRLKAAKAWSGWESATVHLLKPDYVEPTEEDLRRDVSMARIECHYFMNDSFLRPNQLLEDIDRIRHIPTWIIHGRYDVVCPVKNAWDLHQAFPEANLEIIPDAGHAFDEPGILDALIRATENFKKRSSAL